MCHDAAIWVIVTGVWARRDGATRAARSAMPTASVNAAGLAALPLSRSAGRLRSATQTTERRAGVSETFNVAQILRASGGALVSDKRLASDEVDRDTAERPGLTRGPRICELQT